MFCKYCGTEISENAVFCFKCGMKISTEPQIQNTADIRFSTSVSPKRKFKKLPFIIIAILVVIAIAFASRLKHNDNNTIVQSNNDIVVTENDGISVNPDTLTSNSVAIDNAFKAQLESSSTSADSSAPAEKPATDSSAKKEATAAPADKTTSNATKTNNATNVKATKTINFDTVLEYNDYTTIYDFEKSRRVGATNVLGTTIDYEGLYGLSATINGNDLSYHYYCHTKKADKSATVILHKYGTPDEYISKVDDVGANDIHYDISSLDNSLYVVSARLKCDGQNNTVNMFMYVNGTDSYLCRVYNNDAKHLESYRTYWFNTINTIDPKDCLSVDEMTYPTSGANGHVNHVNLWVEKGKTLIKDDWSDEAKVFSFVNYIYRNIAYDKYKVNVLGHSRAREASTSTYDGYSDDKNFAYYTGVGVCWDYTNILAIMCRSNGIPCTSVDTPTHTYNAVYLNGHWVLIDITMFYAKCCDNRDTSMIGNTSISFQKLTNGYSNYTKTDAISSIGKQIWTYKNATDPTNDINYKITHK